MAERKHFRPRFRGDNPRPKFTVDDHIWFIEKYAELGDKWAAFKLLQMEFPLCSRQYLADAFINSRGIYSVFSLNPSNKKQVSEKIAAIKNSSVKRSAVMKALARAKKPKTGPAAKVLRTIRRR